MNHNIHFVILTFFKSFIDGQHAATEAGGEAISWDNAALKYDNGRLTFMIRGLYQHLLDRHMITSMSYSDFRDALYASDINSQLAKIDYAIVVHDNTERECESERRGKVDSNWYELKPLTSLRARC